jgi:3-dehydroquinate dehydratase-2
MLGIREPEQYGSDNYQTLLERICDHCGKLGIEAVCKQSNHEGDLVDWIQEAYFEKADAIVINPGAYTHTSIALLDALKALDGRVPVVEVHLSNVHTREDFRKHLVTTQGATGVIAGFGSDSYLLALDALNRILKK